MKPRDEWGPADDLANLLLNVSGAVVIGCFAALVLLYGLAVLDSYNMLPWATRPAAAREMTRSDIECDWRSKTITIKPGSYTAGPFWKLCGWSLDGEGTIYLDGNGSTISPAEMMSK